jgi:hypothetical protein
MQARSKPFKELGAVHSLVLWKVDASDDIPNLSSYRIVQPKRPCNVIMIVIFVSVVARAIRFEQTRESITATCTKKVVTVF